MPVIIQCCLLFVWLHTLNSVNAEELTCYTGDGVNYRGKVARTISGKTCQRWSVQRPHEHSRTPENHPQKGLDNNYCRNPDNELMPWCYTTDSETRWEYCPVPRCDVAPEPELTCFTGEGRNYRGEDARTISGKTCQRWSAQMPHKHDRTPENHPHKGLDNNYCRNPDNELMPWCYTTDSETRWEYCPVPLCDVAPGPELTCYTGDGRNYRGEVASTISRKTCQRWSVQRPHEHTRTPENHPHRGLDSNYCRNPDNERMPWCYTTDSQTRWEYCPVPLCDVAPAPELTCYTGDGRNYRGEVASTISGKTCQRWSVQRPHEHTRTPENHPHRGLDSNYCRNPDNERMPWCYTTDSEIRWEYCPVPLCDVAPGPELTCYTGDGVNYRGEVARTISGKTCQGWSTQRPHEHTRTPENHPHKGLDKNYCRNPDSEMMPWCYTTDSQTRWEYCPVPSCDDAPGPGPTMSPATPAQFSQCGRPYLGFSTRISFGKVSRPGVNPWQASLQIRTTGSSDPFVHACGGVLIASCWVLTAAHCIQDYTEMQVVLGAVDITKHEDYVQVIRVERAIPHNDYRKTIYNTAHNDVALLQLKVTDSPFCAKESVFVKTACLPNKRFPDGKVCVTSGWGSTEHFYKPDKLSYARIPLMSKQQCVEKYVGQPLDIGLLDDTMICAGDMVKRVDTCEGDSGGPLMCKEDGVHYIAGVVSWGTVECGGHQSLPGFYADVLRYVGWINQTIS